jgi:alkanesulfonate monooxygenase SsuD/methylene tetrahydromethanopterin reductase-like flavin-dependent oxidoreductase (luciferase family)
MDFAIMIEGQDGLTWARWKRIVRAVEGLGFAGLYRSDHLTNPYPPDKEALELWASLTWLADNTQRIEFGPLVAPFSFRHPVITAWTALAVDELSGGRLRLGVGAGWQEREHQKFGLPLLDPRRRFARFREGLEVVYLLLRSSGPVDYAGQFYQLREAQLLSGSPRKGTPAIVVGGNGPGVTLRLAARYADEWNGVYITAERFRELNALLDTYLVEAGRRPGDVRRTLMTGTVFHRTDAGLRERLAGRDPLQLRQRGVLVGTPSALAEQVAELEEAGVQRLMLQWLYLDDMENLEALAQAVVGQ